MQLLSNILFAILLLCSVGIIVFTIIIIKNKKSLLEDVEKRTSNLSEDDLVPEDVMESIKKQIKNRFVLPLVICTVLTVVSAVLRLILIFIE